MANLSSIRLEVGRVNSSTEFARVTGIVSWSGREQQENLAYVVRANLRERDDSRDTWNMLPDGSITRLERGDDDEIVGFIGSTTLFPNNQSSRPFDIRRNFDFGNQEPDNKVNKHIQIEDLNQNEIQEFRKISDEEIGNIVGGLEPPEGGGPCPMGGILGELLCY